MLLYYYNRGIKEILFPVTEMFTYWSVTIFAENDMVLQPDVDAFCASPKYVSTYNEGCSKYEMRYRFGIRVMRICLRYCDTPMCNSPFRNVA